MFKLFAIMFASVAFATSAQAVTVKQLEEKARKEARLNINTNHLLYGDILVEAFAKKYPFIKINHLKFSPVHTNSADHFEDEDPNKRADVILRCQEPSIFYFLEMNYLADLQSLPNWKNRSKVEEQSPYYHNFLGAPHVIAYNPEKVAEKDLPSSYDDLLDPKWNKKVVMRSPRRGNSPDFFTSYIRKTRGIEWFSKFAKNTPYIAQNGNTVHELVESGEYPIGLSRDLEVMTHIRDYKASTGKESKLKYKFLEKDRPYQYQLVMMNSTAPHSAAAKLFVNWTLSQEAQDLMYKHGLSVGERHKELISHKKVWQWNLAKDKITNGAFISYLAKAIRLMKANGATLEAPFAQRAVASNQE